MKRNSKLDRVRPVDEHKALARLKTTEYHEYYQRLVEIDRALARDMLKILAADWELGCQAIWLAACFAWWGKRA